MDNEIVYLLDNDKYLHLRENNDGVGYATYDKLSGFPLETGQIYNMHLPPDGEHKLEAARNWYMFELSDEPPKAIQIESVNILEEIRETGIRARRIWEPDSLSKDDIRIINSHYDDLYRIPSGGIIQIDYPDGSCYTAKCEKIDDYHFDLGGQGNVYHICQFAEIIERNGMDCYPEIQTLDDTAAWKLGNRGYLAIQSCDDGWDYSVYDSNFSLIDGGQLDVPELTIQEAKEQILQAYGLDKGHRTAVGYNLVLEKAAEREEAAQNKKPSVGKLKEKCDVPECSPTGCKKARDAHEL